jgi:hypothetical protein
MRIVEILKPYVPYVLYSVMGAILAGNLMDISQKQSVIFGLATLICFLFVDKIFLKVFNFKIKVPTIREQLMQECPKDVKAGGKIAPGNAATYEKYLFSGCEKNDTCDDAVADEISSGIINKSERCGDWNLVSTGLTYSEDKGWTKSQDCAAYTPDSSYLPDQCIKNMWEESGCTNIEAADRYYKHWKKMTKKAIGVDIKSWEHLKDNTHRGLCYGPDPTKWPQPIDCKTFGDNDLIPPICQKEIWKDVGCLTPNNGTSDWWNKQTKKVIKGDMKLWATEIDDEHRTRCYGADKTKWPRSPVADFPRIFNIVHPNGSPWRYYATDTIKLKNGLKVRMSIYDNANVFNHILGNVALHDLQNDKYLRHANFLLHSDAFAANNGDFAWNFKKTPSGYNIYNDYGGGYYVGYDPGQDVVLIVPPGSSLIVSWKITAAVDDERMVVGNNGTVSCDMYCHGLGGLSWNGELPADWKGAQCETAGIYQTTGCGYVGKDGSTPSGLYCTCTRNDAKPYTKNKTPWIVPLHAVELCQVGQGPWGACPGFLGPNAKWICDLPGSDRGARVAMLGYFIYEYTNNGGPIQGRLNIIVDDYASIDVNNTVIASYSGGWGGQGGVFSVSLATGLTRFIIGVTNTGGPAGFVAAVVDGNNSVLFQTDASWIYSPTRGTYNDVSYKPIYTIATSGLLLHLDAGNRTSYPASGSTWSDLSGNGRNASLTNGPGFDSGNGGSIQFNGAGAYATVATGLATGNTPHSLEMWVNFSSITNSRWWLAVIGQYTTGAEHWIGGSPTSTQFGVWNMGAIAPNLLGANRWLHLVSTYNGSTYTVYVNSTNPVSTNAFQCNFQNTTLNLARANPGEQFFNGKIGVVRVYNRVLSLDEISQNYNSQRGRFGL